MILPDEQTIRSSLPHEDTLSLRLKAQARVARLSSTAASTLSAEELLYELRVHQIELEIQNEELRNSRIALEKARDHYIEFYDLAPIAYFTLLKTGQISAINLTAARLLGVERDKLARRFLSRHIAPEDRNNWQQFFTSAVSCTDKLSCELAFRRDDGSQFHAHLETLRGSKIGEAGEIHFALTDITRHKQSENALREQEVFLNMITENSDDFIAVLDLKGRRLYNSPSYTRLFGNVDSLIGSDSFAEIHPDDRKYLQQVFKETVETGNGMQATFRFLLPDRSVRHMESRGTVLKNSNGVALRVVVVSRDITERKRAAEVINSLALYDSLTGKSNYRLLHDRLEHAMTTNKRRGCFGALLFIDLDNLSGVNELHGQAAGDSLLVEMSDRISCCVREVDTVSRFGGDQFAVLLGELSADKFHANKEAGIVAEKIRLALSEPYSLKVKREGKGDTQLQHSCAVNIGVFLIANSESSAEEFIKKADRLMHQAKNDGGNKISIFDSIR